MSGKVTAHVSINASYNRVLYIDVKNVNIFDKMFLYLLFITLVKVSHIQCVTKHVVLLVYIYVIYLTIGY